LPEDGELYVFADSRDRMGSAFTYGLDRKKFKQVRRREEVQTLGGGAPSLTI
jgi:hypothetical protein